MNTFIPKEIIAGFQERNTKTGKLAFLTYLDKKGKIKFETSWSNWKSDKIPVETFKNDIMTTLYIGNAAGGCKSGWNYRQEYIQLSDDRGITFEIPTDEFLELLDYSICDHGILKGEFVFGWTSNYLHVISTEEECYKAIKEHSEMINNKKITKVSEMIPGKAYKLRNICWEIRREVEENTCYFIGSLPVIKYDLKTSSTKLVFVHKDKFFFSDIKNVEYENSNFSSLSETDLKEYINRFEHSPYSKKFWKEYRFKGKLIQNESTFEKNTYKDNIWTSLLDENGNILTHKIESEDCYDYKSWNGKSWGISIINPQCKNGKVINWCNILKDEEINIPIEFVNYPDTWRYSRGYLPLIDECIILNSKDREKVRKNWNDIKTFINNHTENRPLEFDKCYDFICDGYSFNLSEFLYMGFIFGPYGNFSVNKIYDLVSKNE